MQEIQRDRPNYLELVSVRQYFQVLVETTGHPVWVQLLCNQPRSPPWYTVWKKPAGIHGLFPDGMLPWPKLCLKLSVSVSTAEARKSDAFGGGFKKTDIGLIVQC
jgi:hypothetical protein